MDQGKIDSKKAINSGTIQNDSNDDIGVYYAEIEQAYSEGAQEDIKIMIGKSKKSWLCFTIVEAVLTKDLEWFSKMDPFCKIAISKG